MWWVSALGYALATEPAEVTVGTFGAVGDRLLSAQITRIVVHPEFERYWLVGDSGEMVAEVTRDDGAHQGLCSVAGRTLFPRPELVEGRVGRLALEPLCEWMAAGVGEVAVVEASAPTGATPAGRSPGVRPAAVVHATGSCGTQVGLLLGLASAGIPVSGICVSRPKDDQETRLKALLARIVTELQLDAKLAGLAIEADDRFIGPGYGQPSPGMVEAVRLAAEYEGLFLDPVYTGKGFAGLVQRIREGRYRKDEAVVFVHTGGLPGLFVYDEAFA